MKTTRTAQVISKLARVLFGFVLSVLLATGYRLIVVNRGIEISQFWSTVALAVIIVPFVLGVTTLIEDREKSKSEVTDD